MNSMAGWQGGGQQPAETSSQQKLFLFLTMLTISMKTSVKRDLAEAMVPLSHPPASPSHRTFKIPAP